MKKYIRRWLIKNWDLVEGVSYRGLNRYAHGLEQELLAVRSHRDWLIESRSNLVNQNNSLREMNKTGAKLP